MPRKKKAKEQNNSGPEEIPAPTPSTPDERLWQRINKVGKTFTDDYDIYITAIRKMTKFDLQEECIRAGIPAHDDRDTMIQRLAKEFKKDASLKTPLPRPIVIKVDAAGRKILQKIRGGLA